jgi:hypothetical protein
MPMATRTVRALLGLSALGLVAATGSATVGFVLAEVYVPDATAWPNGELSSELQGSDGWRTAQVALSFLFLAASVALSFAVAWAARRTRSSALLLIPAGIAVLTAVVTLTSRPLVEWDQLAMWAVTADIDASGHWTAAFDDRVRFLLIDGQEVSQDDYTLVLLVHLAAPVIGAAALLLTTVISIRTDPELRP